MGSEDSLKIYLLIQMVSCNNRSNLISAKIRHGPGNVLKEGYRSVLIVDERSERIYNASLQNFVSKYNLFRFEFE